MSRMSANDPIPDKFEVGVRYEIDCGCGAIVYFTLHSDRNFSMRFGPQQGGTWSVVVEAASRLAHILLTLEQQMIDMKQEKER